MKLKPTEKIETVQVTFTLPKEMADNYYSFCRHYECDKNDGLKQILTDAMRGFDPEKVPKVEKTPRVEAKTAKQGAA